MSKHIVRILVEDKSTRELHWYAAYECDADKLELAVDPPEVRCVGNDVDNIITTFSTTVSMIDLACDLYKTYTDSSGGLNYQGKPCPQWNELPSEIRKHWVAVARRITELGPLFNTPHGAAMIGSALRSAQVFDTSDVDLGSGEG